MKGKLFSCWAVLFVFIGCTKNTLKQFEKLGATQTGITFENTLKNTPQLNILNYLYYYNGAGVVALDSNNDGLTDLYFTGNETPARLFLNRGNLKFEDITEASGIGPTKGWSFGATHVDINNDGLQDIYVCQASKYRGLKGRNQLFINQGINDQGIPTFTEGAKIFGLDFEGLSTQSAFFDYDLDGDLDLFLLNHSVHPNNNYGLGSKRATFDSISGDRFYENIDGHYVDRSKEAGIYQGKSGYGLGLSISDVNNDGYPDIYVGNDFFENDYLYINQKNGSFKEIISEDDTYLGHTTHFSMGNDIADINNDGLVDIISLDMLPENLQTYKTSGLEYPYPIYRQYLNKGFAPQYMQNSLHLNLGGNRFAEIGNLSGISATEWSWGALIADWDNDGHSDLFITNGIKGATNDMDYMNFIANEDIQRRIDAGMTQNDLPLVNELPEKKVPNYFFKNNGDLTFTDVSSEWSENAPSFSNGCTYADLDNDGDLDIIVNAIDEPAYILENTNKERNYLQVKLKGIGQNRDGIGGSISIFQHGHQQHKQHFISKGYLSAKDHTLHFGLGGDSIIDSIRVTWPNKTSQIFKQVNHNQTLVVDQNDALLDSGTVKQPPNAFGFSSLSESLLDFKHKEQVSVDFDREPLIPFANSNQGPSISVSDVNNDGLDDVFFTGGKRQASALFLQTISGGFQKSTSTDFERHKLNEDVASVFVDVDNDGDKDLIVASAGNEFTNGKALVPRLYENHFGKFMLKENTFAGFPIHASGVYAIHIDNDNAIDIIITSDRTPHKYGKTPKQYIFRNNGQGNFKEVTFEMAPEFQNIGQINNIAVTDLNADGLQDFIAVGHWMPISVFINSENGYQLQKDNGLSNTSGWWNAIELADFDNDGDIDLFCGNWGLNTKFKASKEQPITMYLADFDSNGAIDPIITYYHQGTETPFASKDELVKQMPFLNKKFLSYKSFAEASMNELFDGEQLKNSEKKQLNMLETAYFENVGGANFEKGQLPIISQSSIVYDIMVDDLNSDGYKDVLIVGNDHEISTQLGRLDAFHGLFLQNDKKGGFLWNNDALPHISGASRAIEKITMNGSIGYVIGRNDSSPLFLLKKKN